MSDIYFIVPGEPVAKGRPRFGRGHTYTPRKTREAELHIQQCFNVKYPRWHAVNSDIPFSVTVNFYSKSFKRMDLDNLIKTFLDGLNGIVWKDDSQVQVIKAQKSLVAILGEAHTEAWIDRLGV